MAWEWSHGQVNYQYVKAGIYASSREWLEVVWSEWVATMPRKERYIRIFSTSELDNRRYYTALARAKGKTDEQLADFIWGCTERLATATNGGWLSWCCPFGCNCHMLPFSPEENG